jgi:hypothetical protein
MRIRQAGTGVWTPGASHATLEDIVHFRATFLFAFVLEHERSFSASYLAGPPI